MNKQKGIDEIVDSKFKDLVWDFYMKVKFRSGYAILISQVIAIIISIIVMIFVKGYSWLFTIMIWILFFLLVSHYKICNKEYEKMRNNYKLFKDNYNNMCKTFTQIKDEQKDLEYKDDNGIPYHLGDIVYNPCFGDYWVVREYTQEEMKQNDTDCPYCLALNDNKDDYCADIDEPKGFIIVARQGEIYYETFLANLRKHSEEVNKEIEENENASKDKE